MKTRLTIKILDATNHGWTPRSRNVVEMTHSPHEDGVAVYLVGLERWTVYGLPLVQIHAKRYGGCCSPKQLERCEIGSKTTLGQNRRVYMLPDKWREVTDDDGKFAKFM